MCSAYVSFDAHVQVLSCVEEAVCIPSGRPLDDLTGTNHPEYSDKDLVDDEDDFGDDEGDIAQVDSLNVSVATGIILHSLLSKRKPMDRSETL